MGLLDERIDHRVTGYRTIFNLRWTLSDRDGLAPYQTLTAIMITCSRRAIRPTCRLVGD